jgi:hypothetical protein
MGRITKKVKYETSNYGTTASTGRKERWAHVIWEREQKDETRHSKKRNMSINSSDDIKKKALENLLSIKKDPTQRAQEAEASPSIESSPIESEVETKGKRRGQARLWLRLQPTVMVGGAIGDTAENGRRT